MIQLHAGYIIDCIKESLEIKYGKSEVTGLLTQLSFFDIEIDSNTNQTPITEFEQVFSVAHNIISRGLPTRPSLWLEEQLLSTFDYTQLNKDLLEIGSVKQELKVNDTFIESIITKESSKRLDLQEGNIVNILIKASDLSILRVLHD